MLKLIEMARGGVVYDAHVATRLGELLLEAHYGASELERQRPLIAVDKGEYWRVEGSWNRDRKLEGIGSFFLSVRKHDGAVLDLGVWGVIHPHPDILPLLSARQPAKPDK